MKVLIATPLYPPQLGGPATRTKLFEKLLPEQGIDVAVVSFGKIRRLPWGIRHGVYFFELLTRGKQCDIMLAQDAASVGLPAVIASKLLRKPLIMVIVGDFVWEQGTARFGVTDSLETFSKQRAGAYYQPVRVLKWGQTWVARSAQRVIVPSAYLKTIVSNWGVSQKAITVIPNAVSDLSNKGNRKTLRGLLRFQGKFVISAGRLIPHKRFDALVRLVPSFVKRFPEFKLLIVGDGPERQRLETCVTRLKLHNHVVLTGALPRDVLFSYIKAADVFVLNSTYEGFSHVLLESLSIGTPVVATRIGGNLEIIEHEKSGLLVGSGKERALEDALLRVLSDTVLAARLSRGGMARAKQFSEERMIAAFVDIFRRV